MKKTQELTLRRVEDELVEKLAAIAVDAHNSSQNGVRAGIREELEAIVRKYEGRQRKHSPRGSVAQPKPRTRRKTREPGRRTASSKKATEKATRGATITVDREVARPLLQKAGITTSVLAKRSELSSPAINNLIGGKTPLSRGNQRHEKVIAVLKEVKYPFKKK